MIILRRFQTLIEILINSIYGISNLSVDRGSGCKLFYSITNPSYDNTIFSISTSLALPSRVGASILTGLACLIFQTLIGWLRALRSLTVKSLFWEVLVFIVANHLQSSLSELQILFLSDTYFLFVRLVRLKVG